MKAKDMSIGLMLMGTILLFGSVGSADLTSNFPSEIDYPDSLDSVMAFHEEFVHPAFSQKFAEGGKGLNASSDIFMDLKRSFFGEPEPQETFRGVVAINTDKGGTVTCEGQFRAAPADVNLMDIDISNITVISINTARGGKAIATSEIMLEPVQNNADPS